MLWHHWRDIETAAKSEMKIDMDALSESELIDLNNRIIQPQRFLHQMHTHATILEFPIGKRVCLQQSIKLSVVARCNKTVAVLTEAKVHGNVFPGRCVRQA